MTGAQSSQQLVRVVLVQCTASKRDQPAYARDLYDESAYFRKQRKYAETVADEWYVQSAKHGLVHPKHTIEPYDLRASDLDDPVSWARGIAGRLDHLFDEAVVEILGGKHYADPLTPELELRGFDVVEPLRGQRIGTRQKSLGEMMNRSLEGFA
jgi:hypothetical protein